MAYQEVITRAIVSGRAYEDLPIRIKNSLTPGEYRTRVKDYCIQKGLSWSGSLASSMCNEQDYYEDLIKAYLSWMRLFPYHLADYVCRIMRLTPFKYYSELLFSVMKEEKSYAGLPNFTAADILRVLGIGRNEYIRIMNASKGKRLLWRVNRGVLRDYLPAEVADVKMDPWWRVCVVNLSEQEYRELDEASLANLKTANAPGEGARVRDLDPKVLRSLFKRGLVYLQIPIAPDDRFSIPPLEGFVSNKTSVEGDTSVDPVEVLLYSVFVASSERLKVAELAGILNVPLTQLQAALSLACRLGFAAKLGAEDGSMASGRAFSPTPAGGDFFIGEEDEGNTAGGLPMPAADGGIDEGGGEKGLAVAVIVDAEATSYLMMGALSPGLKRHSVTLFEGGRVGGDEVIKELIAGLWTSHEAGQGYEGDLLHLTNYAASLATVLEAVQSGSAGAPIELLRKESLAGLTPSAVRKVLHHAYCAVVPITPLPYPPLPLTTDQPGPANFGPTTEAAGPWLQLALYTTCRCGPLSLVFLCGQRVWRLPSQLEHCTHALLWPWVPDTDPARTKGAATDGAVILVEATFLLYSLNEMLSRTAVLVQPIACGESAGGMWEGLPTGGTAGGSKHSGKPEAVAGRAGSVEGSGQAGAACSAEDAADDDAGTMCVVDVPLPLAPAGGTGGSSLVTGVERRTGLPRSIPLQTSVRQAIRDLGLGGSLGFLRVVRMPSRGDSQYQHQAPVGAIRWPEAAPMSSAVPDLISFGSMGSGSGTGLGAMQESGTNLAEVSARPSQPWLPLSVQLGVPLYCPQLCKAVCDRALQEGFLSTGGRSIQAAGQACLQQQLYLLMAQYAVQVVSTAAVAGAPEVVTMGVELPARNLLFDGNDLQLVDFSDCMQGMGLSLQ